MLPRTKKKVAPTHDSAKDGLESIAQSDGNIILMTGINDVTNSSILLVQKKFSETLSTAKSCHPKSKIFVSGIIPLKSDPTCADDINEFIENECKRKNCVFIDTPQHFKYKQNLYRDEKHPNKKGTGVLVKTIKESMGIKSPHQRLGSRGNQRSGGSDPSRLNNAFNGGSGLRRMYFNNGNDGSGPRRMHYNNGNDGSGPRREYNNGNGGSGPRRMYNNGNGGSGPRHVINSGNGGERRLNNNDNGQRRTADIQRHDVKQQTSDENDNVQKVNYITPQKTNDNMISPPTYPEQYTMHKDPMRTNPYSVVWQNPLNQYNPRLPYHPLPPQPPQPYVNFPNTQYSPQTYNMPLSPW